MKDIQLKNGIKLIYKEAFSDITSFCIGFNGGALEEDGFPLGTAHAVEHMVFKETKNRSEGEINKLCDEIFGFQNAMTNYPYVIYYGTTLSEDFNKGLELFSDIVLNPTFPEKGFSEEINVILEELKEWKDDLYQYCEDELLYNAFNERRIKNLIIGTEESIKSITLEDLKTFYKKYYRPDNMVISVVTSLKFELVKDIVENYFKDFKIGEKTFNLEDSNCEKNASIKLYENNKVGVFQKLREEINGAKIQYCYPIHSLNEEDMKMLKLFNFYFGEGTSSILYDIIRTKNGLAYEISSDIKEERGIKLFTITLGTSKDKVEKAIKLINESIEDIKNNNNFFTKEKIQSASKSIKLKKALRIEKSIQLAKDLTCYELMYNSYKKVYDEVENLSSIDGEKINTLINRVLNFPSIQIIK
ncbi:M16 family metallopeptidase [Clostridium lundense]|uniref:M16 family metallopeptidase n=1 Tax=Clostridium lundense TaxID=319475 RepID=UPI000488790A|nr:pitrilysin family protein [Clostridium lundense]